MARAGGDAVTRCELLRQRHDETAGLDQVTSPQALRLMSQPKQPFQPELAQPARCCRSSACHVVHRPAGWQHNARRKRRQVVDDPALLARHAHPNQKKMRREAMDTMQDVAILGTARRRVEVPVMSLDRTSWM